MTAECCAEEGAGEREDIGRAELGAIRESLPPELQVYSLLSLTVVRINTLSRAADAFAILIAFLKGRIRALADRPHGVLTIEAFCNWLSSCLPRATCSQASAFMKCVQPTPNES